MEYVAGGSLEMILKTFGAMPLALSARYARQMAEGLAYVHSEGVLHRDVKAANVLVWTSRAWRRSWDFGTAVTGAAAANVAGDWRYGWRRRCCGRRGTRRRRDVWVAWCTVMEMLTAAAPFEHLGSAYTRLATIAQADGEHPALLARLACDVARDFLRRALQYDPASRADGGGAARAPVPCRARSWRMPPTTCSLTVLKLPARIPDYRIPPAIRKNLAATSSSQSLSVQAQMAFQTFVMTQMTATFQKNKGRELDEDSPTDLMDAVRAAASDSSGSGLHDAFV